MLEAHKIMSNVVNSRNTNSSDKAAPSNLISEIKDALKSVTYGSIEIFIQDKIVTQITVRNIHKTSVEIDSEKNISNKSVRVDLRT